VGHGGGSGARPSVSAVKHSPASENIFLRSLQKTSSAADIGIRAKTNYNSGAHLSGYQPPLVTGFSAWMLAVLNSRESSYVPT
ncbi:hypothetical protein, partial [Pseudomonas sp. GW460-12-10-14-TSB1]